MALERTIVTVPFGQGVDSKTDPKQLATGKLITLENGVFTTRGQIRKRYGTTKYSQTLAEGGSMAAGDSIFSRSGEALVSSAGTLSGYDVGSATWRNRGSLPKVGLAVSDNLRASQSFFSTDSASNGAGTACYVAVEWDGASTFQVRAYLADVVSSAPRSVGVIASGLTSSSTPRVRVAYLNGRFVIAWSQKSGASSLLIKYATLTLATEAVSAATTLITVTFAAASANGCWDILANAAGTRVYLAFPTALADDLTIKYLDNTFALSAGVNVGVGWAGAATNGTRAALGEDTNNGNILAGTTDGATFRLSVVSTALAVVTAGATARVVGAYHSSVAVGLNGSGVPCVWGSRVVAATRDLEVFVTTMPGYAAGATSTTSNAQLASAPFIQSGTAYIAVSVGTGGYSRLLLNASTLAPVARFLDGSGANFWADWYASATSGAGDPATNAADSKGGYPSGTNDVTLTRPWLYGSSWYFPAGMAYGVRASGTTASGFWKNYGADIYAISFPTVPSQSVEIGNLLVIASGFAWAYDGSSVAELGFHHAPGAFSATPGTGGSMGAGTYSYTCIFEWVDGQGQTHRSQPSAPITATVSASGKVTLANYYTLTLTAKPGVRVVWYRTVASGGTIYYRLPSMGGSVTDNQPDVNITGNEQLYTTGGVLDNQPPPAFTAMTVYRNRLVGISAESPRQIWFSQQVVPGQAVCFSDFLVLNMDPVGGDCTSLAALDDKLAIAKSGVWYYVTGNGWDSTGGANDLSVPLLINTNSGCSEPRSVVTAADGVLYRSQKGFYLLDRSLGDHYVGAEVEAYNAQSVLGVVAAPGSNEVRWLLSGGAVLVYDYLFKQWSTFPDVGAGGSQAAIGLAAGVPAVLTTAGKLYAESSSVFRDDGTNITLRLVTGWMGAGDLQSFLRIYKLMLLADWRSSHTLTVKVRYDYNGTSTDTYTITATSDPSPAAFQYRLNLARQKCEAVQVEISDSGSVGALGESLRLSGLTFELGAKRGPMKLPAAGNV